MAKITGLKAIDSGIKELRGVISNVNERVQNLAVAIIEHAAGDGAGDVSRAGHLLAVIPNSMNRAFLTGFFRRFGSIVIDTSGKNKGNARMLSRDAKDFRGYDIDGARANNWFEAIDENGDRAPWYQGPRPAEYQPDGIGDIGGRFMDFAKREAKRLDDTKEVNGKSVPVVDISDDEREQVVRALAVITKVGQAVACRGRLVELTEQVKETEQTIEQSDELLAFGAAENQPAAAAA